MKYPDAVPRLKSILRSAFVRLLTLLIVLAIIVTARVMAGYYNRFPQLCGMGMYQTTWPEELTQVSDAVILFTPQDRARYKPNGNTLTTGRIEEVLSGTYGEDHQMVIMEPYDLLGPEKSTYYYPMQDGESYLLFLQRNEQLGVYEIVDDALGKYPLQGTHFLARLFLGKMRAYQIGWHTDPEDYARYLKGVKAQYPEVF